MVALAFWFLISIKFAIAMLQLFGPSFTFDNIVDCLAIFVIAFSIPVIFILLANFVKPETERFFDVDNLPTKIVFVSSIIAGFIGLAIFSCVRPAEPHAGAYFTAIMIPFIIIFGSYVSVLWITDGFRKST